MVRYVNEKLTADRKMRYAMQQFTAEDELCLVLDKIISPASNAGRVHLQEGRLRRSYRQSSDI